MPVIYRGLAAALICLVMCTNCPATVLFDATANTPPDAQGWAFLTNPLFGAQASQSVVSGVLNLDTSADISEQAGYFSKVPALAVAHPNHPTIDLDASDFSIEFSTTSS